MSEQINKTPEVPDKLQEELRLQLKEWEPELREFLPNMADDLTVTFSNNWLISDYGIGGFAMDTDHIELAFDPDFADKQAQLRDFKGSFFHEVYHTQQTGGGRTRGFTWKSYDPKNKLSALENAILEGAATKFEMLRTGSKPGWGQYPNDVEDWIHEVAELKEDYDELKWKFYDPETDRRWIMYRSGSYIVDQALEKSGKSIENFATLAPMEILTLADIKLKRETVINEKQDNMNQEAITELIQLFSDNNIEIYVDGGWGVDALIGEQTRKHGDLDIAIEEKYVAGLESLLTERHYARIKREEERPHNFVLGDNTGHQIDVHVIVLDNAGNGIYGPPENDEMYPASALTGEGMIGNLTVKCIAPKALVDFHTQYEPDDNDYHDVKLLCEKFDIPLPSIYEKFEN